MYVLIGDAALECVILNFMINVDCGCYQCHLVSAVYSAANALFQEIEKQNISPNVMAFSDVLFV